MSNRRDGVKLGKFVVELRGDFDRRWEYLVLIKNGAKITGNSVKDFFCSREENKPHIRLP
jgi:hypothetical protein